MKLKRKIKTLINLDLSKQHRFFKWNSVFWPKQFILVQNDVILFNPQQKKKKG